MLAAAGAVLVGTATVLGLVLFRRSGVFELTLPELTIWSVVVGVMTIAFLGLVFVEMRSPSLKRRTRSFLFGLFGAICGLIAGVVYGALTIHEVYSHGWSVLGTYFGLFWPALGLVAAIGVTVGAVAGVTMASLTRGSQA
jgi:hypothetical protein